MNKTQDEILRYLLSFKQECISFKTMIKVDRNDFVTSQFYEMGEEIFVKQLTKLKELKYIDLYIHSVDMNLERYIEIELLAPALSYIENEKNAKMDIHKERIRFWVPVILSILSFLLGAFNFVFQFVY